MMTRSWNTPSTLSQHTIGPPHPSGSLPSPKWRPRLAPSWVGAVPPTLLQPLQRDIHLPLLPPPPVCYWCHETGHIAHNCPTSMECDVVSRYPTPEAGDVDLYRKLALKNKEITNLEDTVAALRSDFQKTLNASTVTQKNLEENLVATKHDFLKVQEQLTMAEKLALKNKEITKWEDTVAAMRSDFQKTLNASTVTQKNLEENLVAMKHDFLKVQEKLTVAEKLALKNKEITKREDTVAAIRSDFQKTLNASTVTQKNLEENLVATKHDFLNVQEKLTVAEKTMSRVETFGPGVESFVAGTQVI
ncbi:UNVERIFIED_CONTAM: hypothetical protein FKN15_011969 [Acipenser sinensis]